MLHSSNPRFLLGYSRFVGRLRAQPTFGHAEPATFRSRFLAVARILEDHASAVAFMAFLQPFSPEAHRAGPAGEHAQAQAAFVAKLRCDIELFRLRSTRRSKSRQ